MLFWASDKFLARNQIDLSILQSNRSLSYSHDNICHSMLGLFDVNTGVYQSDLASLPVLANSMADTPTCSMIS